MIRFTNFSDHAEPKTNRVMVRTCNGVELRDLPYLPVSPPPQQHHHQKYQSSTMRHHQVRGHVTLL